MTTSDNAAIYSAEAALKMFKSAPLADFIQQYDVVDVMVNLSKCEQMLKLGKHPTHLF